MSETWQRFIKLSVPVCEVSRSMDWPHPIVLILHVIETYPVPHPPILNAIVQLNLHTDRVRSRAPRAD